MRRALARTRAGGRLRNDGPRMDGEGDAFDRRRPLGEFHKPGQEPMDVKSRAGGKGRSRWNRPGQRLIHRHCASQTFLGWLPTEPVAASRWQLRVTWYPVRPAGARPLREVRYPSLPDACMCTLRRDGMHRTKYMYMLDRPFRVSAPGKLHVSATKSAPGAIKPANGARAYYSSTVSYHEADAQMAVSVRHPPEQRERQPAVPGMCSCALHPGDAVRCIDRQGRDIFKAGPDRCAAARTALTERSVNLGFSFHESCGDRSGRLEWNLGSIFLLRVRCAAPLVAAQEAPVGAVADLQGDYSGG
ncbi:hypothetical protein ACCO45_009184 [Purpureocillium lilacinum]|uniref:Uncharacterized protein n=1 Tax=Purpureocillium lilacinum TaxID=33203 RepID=A0ACC4DJT9_PURLI